MTRGGRSFRNKRSIPSAERRGGESQARSMTFPEAFAWRVDSCWTRQCNGQGSRTLCNAQSSGFYPQIKPVFRTINIFCIVTFFMTFNYILFHNHIIALLIIIMPFIIFYIHFIIKLFIIKIAKIINLK